MMTQSGTTSMNMNGRCLCGAVQVKLMEVKPEVGVCHCGMCRKWVGGPFMSVDAGRNIEIAGRDSIATFSSSDWAERAFCQHCGTHLYYRLKGNNRHFVLVGLFDVNAWFRLDHQIFIDEKPDYYSFSEETNNMTGEEVMKMFLAEQ